jgi:hypothetical protein
MEVGVPQAAHILDFVAADFAWLPRRINPVGAGPIAGGAPALPDEPLRLHVPPHRGIRWQRAERRIGGDACAQIVHMELVAPAGVGGVLGAQHLAQRGAHGRLLAGIGTQASTQPPDRIERPARLVVPPFERRAPEAHRLVADRMLPLARGQGGQRLLEGPLLGRRRQERAHHREAQLRPAILSASVFVVLRHRSASSRRWRDQMRSPPEVSRSIFCGSHGRLADRARRGRQRTEKPEHGDQRDPDVAGKAREQRRAADRPRRRVARSGRAPLARRRSARTRPATSDASAPACPHSPRADPAAARTRQGVGPCRSTHASTTTAARYTRRPRKRTDGGVRRFRHRAQQKLVRFVRRRQIGRAAARLAGIVPWCKRPRHRRQPSACAVVARS